MKKLLTLIISMTLLSGALVMDSCSKAKIKGCMDVDSKNYNAAAEKDDGSCEYEAALVFWYGQTASDGLIADGATALTYYINGTIVGSSATSVYWAAAPVCGQNGAITVNQDLGHAKTQSYPFNVKDQTGFVYWDGTVTFNANICVILELSWSARKKK